MRLSNGSQVLGSEIVASTPTNLGETLKATPEEIKLDPVLLNKGDAIVIKALVDSPAPSVTLDGRIADVTEIKKVDIANPQQGPVDLYQTASLVLDISITTGIIVMWSLVARQRREMGQRIRQINDIVAGTRDQLPDAKINASESA